MDFSETYVKMCEKAKEIQDITLKEDDYCIVIDGEGQKLYQGLLGFHREPFLSPTAIKIVWLPRQDELQDMIPSPMESYERCFKAGSLIAEIDYFIFHPANPLKQFSSEALKFSTIEQLWLAFVMKKKYGKRWSGTDWLEKKGKE